ncbi:MULTISPECIES: glycosyltransferase family 1 protein [unclassified Lentimicrobium]|uniref:glycosyltransferase family 4 protein n=1 Tax=unclassified Lentimicrobium TaxID=2677434 RepID=UPI001553B542|nr:MULTISPECIES: glycosyltransferase family 1 protein [unclassified Lentimicrobium]NPD45980.1 glycosyltransferase family 4 protein [Lentimicrobium sp. S6]NPD84253.1 glycosyltransferase family 4 protein [Lentimicrobium sp. L6]
MRIGIEGQRLFRKEKHGMDIVAMELIKSLQLLDSANEYFIFVKDGDDDTWFEPTKNFHIIRLKKRPYHLWEQFTLPRAVLKHKVDILHCTSNTAPMFITVPLVLTLHDIIYLENFKFISYKSTLYQLIGNFYRRWVVPRILKQSKRIITVSNTERSTIVQKYPKLRDKLRVIYNSYGESFKSSKQNNFKAVKEKYQLPDKYFFCLGNTSPKKNLTNILKAYYTYLDNSDEKVPLVLADHSPGDLFLFLNSANSDYKDYLKFIGYVSNWEIPSIYKNSQLFIYPSIRESFGIPILEGMVMGTPVITSNISCMPEIAGEGACFVDPFDSDSIAEGIMKYSVDSVERDNLIEAGYRQAEKYSWLKSAKMLKALYEDVFQLEIVEKGKKPKLSF